MIFQSIFDLLTIIRQIYNSIMIIKAAKFVSQKIIYHYSFFGKLFKTKVSPNPPPKRQQNQVNSHTSTKQLQKQQQQQYDVYSRKKEIDHNIDYARLREKTNYVPDQIGKIGISQIVYWTEGVTTMDGIIKLLKSFNQAKLTTTEQIPTDYKFIQFVSKVNSMVYLCKDFQTMLIFARFGRLYRIQQTDFWLRLEEKLSKKLAKIGIEDLRDCLEIFHTFAEANQGESIYYQIEQLITYNIQSLTNQQIAQSLNSFYRVKKGDKTLIQSLLKKYQQNLPTINLQILINTLPTIKQIQSVNSTFWNQLQTRMLLQIDRMDIIQISTVAETFGYDRGSEALWKLIQFKFLPLDVSQISLKKVLRGFLHTYRCSTAIISKLKPLIQYHLALFSVVQLSEISKSFYIYEAEDKNLDLKIQGIIIEYLRDVDLINLHDLVSIAKNYCVTRNGTRDIYKMLQIVIIERFQDLTKDRFLFDSLCTIYGTSDLCSVQLLKMLKQSV